MPNQNKSELLDAILTHVPFDGWSEAAMEAGARDCGVDPKDLRARFPRGAVDAALAYHRRGDDTMVQRLEEADLDAMRFRDRIAAGVRFRLEAEDREVVRRGMALFAMPQHVADGGRAIWETSDRIWTALGDTSGDVNWYTKRTTLAGVYSTTILFWLGDDSTGNQATWDFLDRRIEDVMRIETAKGKLRDTELWRAFRQGPGRFLDQIKAPGTPRPGYPGSWNGDTK